MQWGQLPQQIKFTEWMLWSKPLLKVPFHIPMKYFLLTFFPGLQVPLLLSTPLHVSLPLHFPRKSNNSCVPNGSHFLRS